MENKELNIVYDVKDDLKDDLVTVFSVAKGEYDSLVKYLSEKVFKGRVEFEKGFENTEFSFERGLKDLDMILQYSLLELEFKNGNIRDEVVDAIEGVCHYGSLMDEFRFDDEFFNWTQFNNLVDNKESGKKLEELNVYISKVSRDFANFLLFYQPEEDRNFRAFIQEKMNNIINVIEYQNKDLVGNEFRSACLANAMFRQLVK